MKAKRIIVWIAVALLCVPMLSGIAFVTAAQPAVSAIAPADTLGGTSAVRARNQANTRLPFMLLKPTEPAPAHSTQFYVLFGIVALLLVTQSSIQYFVCRTRVFLPRVFFASILSSYLGGSSPPRTVA